MFTQKECKRISSEKKVVLGRRPNKLLLFTIGVMKLVDMFPLGWNGLNTMQVQILPPINKRTFYICFIYICCRLMGKS